MTRKPRRKPTGQTKLRVRIGGCGPMVLPETNETLLLWAKVYGVPCGQALDALLSFAKAHPQTFQLPTRRKNAVVCRSRPEPEYFI